MLRVTPRSRGLRILVVDDHSGVRQLIVLILEQAGHLVDDVANANEALAHLRQVTYDVVLSDQRSGLGLATEIRRRWPGVGFILVTGLGSRITPERAAAAGADAMLAKPFRGAELRELVWQACAPISRWREYRVAR